MVGYSLAMLFEPAIMDYSSGSSRPVVPKVVGSTIVATCISEVRVDLQTYVRLVGYHRLGRIVIDVKEIVIGQMKIVRSLNSKK